MSLLFLWRRIGAFYSLPSILAWSLAYYNAKIPLGDGGIPELYQPEPDAAVSWPCSFLAWEAVFSGVVLGRIYYPHYHLSEFGVITYPIVKLLYQNGQEGKKEKKRKEVSRVIHLAHFSGLLFSIKCSHQVCNILQWQQKQTSSGDNNILHISLIVTI